MTGMSDGDDETSSMLDGRELTPRVVLQPRLVRTPRLVLTPLDITDVDEVYSIYSSPETWRHLPGGRHRVRAQTIQMVHDAQTSLATSGLGPWAARIGAGVDAPGLGSGTLIGVGGLQMTAAKVWNLGYRLSPASWSRGFALEIAKAAIVAGTRIASSTPITARVLANNPASATVITRAGLSLLWEGRPCDATLAASDKPHELRSQVYTDRPLSEPALAWLQAHS
jgi:RimJ/RimL family protein N-acetyltransferase